MKKFLLFLTVLFSLSGHSQAISVTPTASADMSSLINNSLLSATCAGATNVTSNTGTNFGSTNGIGSFINTNPNFPIKNGIVLSTGNVANALGPNNSTLNEGNVAGWGGDSDLEAALAAAGSPMTSANATSVSFNFTPISSQFSFDFVFASEEYGNFQCQFSDAFAFLLTNTVTGVTTNLAVLPGTNTPISVSTIRDTQYNTGCPSVNPSFFGNYYGGTNSGISPTNFNGQTVLLNASASLTPNVLYTIKIVIADNGNYLSDSAIFISGTSFNIGQDVLGPDKTVFNKTAVCFGEVYTINTGLNAADYTFQWSKNGGTPASGGPSYPVTDIGVYKVTYLKNGSTCPPESYEIRVEFYDEIIPTPPIDIYRCTSAGPTFSYNIAQNTPIVLSGITGSGNTTAGTEVTYYLTPRNADTKTSPLPSPYTALPNTIIYARVENKVTNCYVVKNFRLLLAPPPTATNPGTLTDCEASNGSNNANFVFNSQNVAVLNGQSSTIYSVLYYDTQAHATAGGAVGLLPDSGSLQTNGKTIFIRVQNATDPTCFDATTSFVVNVNPRPVINDVIQDRIVCVNYILPPLSAGVQYWTATGGTGTQLFAGDAVTNLPPFLEPQTVYLYAPSTCLPPVEKSFKVTVINLTKLNPNPLPQCKEYILPSIEYASYWTAPNATGTQLQPGDTISSSQTIYLYYVALEAPFCVNQDSFALTIEPLPVLANYANVFRCAGETYTLPALVQPAQGSIGYFSAVDGGGTAYATDGTEVISTNGQKYIFVYLTSGTTLNCGINKGFYLNIGLTPLAPNQKGCPSFKLPPLNVGASYYTGSGGTGTVYTPGTSIFKSQTLYVYAPTDPSLTCQFIEYSFNVIVNIPELIPPSYYAPVLNKCGSYTLPVMPDAPINTSVTPNQSYLPFFYNTKSDGTGTTIPAGTTLTATTNVQLNTRLYVVVFATDDVNCYRGEPLDISINPVPSIITDANPDRCDKYGYVVPVTNPDVKFYTGAGGTGTVLPAGTVLRTTQTVYAYGVIGICNNELPINITIFPATVAVYPIPATSITACDSYTLPTLTGGTRCFDTKDGYVAQGYVEYSAGHVFTATQTVYFYNENEIRYPYVCKDGDNPFVITINKTPALSTFANVVNCESYTLPALPVIANTQVNYFDQPSGLGTKYLAGQVITSTIPKMYVYAETATTPNCTDEEFFSITINKVTDLPDVSECGSYNLPLNTTGTTPTPVEGDYYTATGGPTGTGVLIPKGTAITPTFPAVTGTPSYKTVRTFYIYKQYPSTVDASGFCVSETQFDITIITKPVANAIPLVNRTFCDEFDLINDGLYKQDLTLLNALVLNPAVPPVGYIPQSGPEFVVSYYPSLADANASPPTNAITTTSDLKNVWVRVDNTLAPTCFDVIPLQFFVNKIPETNPKDGIVCADNVTGLILAPYVIKSGLPTTGYTFEWNNSTSATPIATTNNLSVTVSDAYSVVATDVATGCKSAVKTAIVKQSTKAIATYSLSENFSDNQFVTVFANGGAGGNGGDYIYQLDDEDPQESPVFENVPYGAHIITVIDRNGCLSTPINILVVNYPKFFTPNGDGINDKWNIIGLEKPEPVSNVFIYDRFGKLITQVKPYASGWDGTFNGENLPSTDYWFAVTYLDNNVEKVFKSHFTLKR